MLLSRLGVRTEQRTINFNATTSVYNYGTLNANYNANIPQTWLALIRPTGAGEGNFGYVASKVSTGSATGMRLIVDHNTNSPRIIFGMSSGNTGPSRTTPNGSITYNRWTWVAVTYASGLAASNIRIFLGEKSLQEVQSYAAFTDGTGSIDSTSSYNFNIGNREGTDRTFAGDIALIVRWDSVLTLPEINQAIQIGPLAVRRRQLLLCWAGGQEISPHKLRASTITAKALGRPVIYPIERTFRPAWLAEIAGGGGQTILPGGIGSLEAFGSTVVLPGAVTVTPSAIDSLEAFGSTVVVPGGVTVTPSAISSLEAFGTTTITQGGVSVICSGIASTEAFGSTVVSPGAVTIVCSGIATTEAFGDTLVSAGGSIISATGIASLEAFGSHTVTPGGVTIITNGIATAEVFGSTTVQVSGQFITATGIASAEGFGTPMIAVGSVTVICSGIASAEAFGSFVITGGAITQLEGLLMYVIPKQSRIYTVQ